MNKIKLNERLKVKDLQYIGSDYGMDLYKINSFDAGLKLKNAWPNNQDNVFLCATAPQPGHESEEECRACWDEYIVGQGCELYVFTDSATNGARAFITKNLESGNDVSFKFEKRIIFKIVIPNGVFEESIYGDAYEQRIAKYEGIYPFYLIPEFQTTYAGGFVTDSLKATDGLLNAYYPGLAGPLPQEVTIPDNINTIGSNSFVFTNNTRLIVNIPNTVQKIERNAFNDFSGVIRLDFSKKQENEICEPEWTNSPYVIWNDMRDTQDAMLARRERHLSRRESPILDVLRYKEEGNHIVILGMKEGKSDIEIPAEINGKPVTKIAPFAFYNNSLLKSVTLPDTIEEVGKAAFYNCPNLKTFNCPDEAILYSDSVPQQFRKYN